MDKILYDIDNYTRDEKNACILFLLLGNSYFIIISLIIYDIYIIEQIAQSVKLLNLGPFVVFLCTDKSGSIQLCLFVKMICNEAFSCCKYLKKINLSKNLQKTTNQLGSNACFKKCERLKGIEIPAGIKEIPNMMFFGCRELSEVVFHDGLEVIGASAFASCRNLKKVSLPKTVKRIKQWAVPYVDELHLASNVVPDGLVLGLNNSSSSVCARVIFPDGREVLVSKTVNPDVEDKATLQLNKHCQDPDWYKYSSNITSLLSNGLIEYERRRKEPEKWPDNRPEQAELKGLLRNNSVTLMNWLLTHDKRQSLAKLINYGFLPDSALNELLTYANEHNMPDIAAYTIQQIQKGETPDTKFHI